MSVKIDKESLRRALNITGPQTVASYVIFKENGVTKAKNGLTGQIDFSGTDAATVIQSAINALTYGGSIFIKKAEYLLTSQILIKNKSNLKILSDFATLKVGTPAMVSILIGEHGATEKQGENILIEGIIFNGNYPTISNGAGLDISAHDNVIVRNCVFRNHGERALRPCVWSETETRKRNIIIENCFFDRDTVVLGGIDGGALRNCYFVGNPHIQNSVIDFSYGEVNNSMVRDFILEGNKFVDITNVGVVVGFQRAEDDWIIGNTFRNCTAGSAIDMLTFVVPGVTLLRQRIHILNNNFININNGIILRSDLSECIGNIFSGVGGSAIVVRSSYCVISKNITRNVTYWGLAEEATADYNLITDNDFTGTVTISGANTIVKRNRGFVTENSGTATIAAGSTYVDVPHGLSITPDINRIKVTPKDNLAGRSFWVSNVTSTTFRINISSSDTVDHSFGWSYE